MPNTFSYWEKENFFSYDAVVIGGGIVGLNAAVYLKKLKPFLRVAVLEAGFLPNGASTKNAGFACFGSISELIEQENSLGTDALCILIEKRWQGLQKLRQLLGDKAIDYQNFGGYELFKNSDNGLAATCVSKIEHYNQITKHIVGKNAYQLQNQKIKTFKFKQIEHLIYNAYEAQIDPGKMMQALADYARRLGVNIINSCLVTGLVENSNNIQINTPHGPFKAKKILVCTNAFTQLLLPELAIKPGRGQVLVTKPIPNLHIQGTFHYDKGYYYFRNINQRILLGGGRNIDFKTEETLRFGKTARVQNALKKLLTEVILPNQPYEIDYSWSGIMAFGAPLTPFIGEVRPNIFCATRCNGMGIAIGSQSGQDLANLVINSL